MKNVNENAAVLHNSLSYYSVPVSSYMHKNSLTPAEVTRSLDEAVNSSRNNPTRLIKNLVSIFLTGKHLSKSHVCGMGNKHVQLDSEIISDYYN